VLLPLLGAFMVGEVGLAGLLAVTLLTLCFVVVPVAAVRRYVRDHARKLGFLSATATARVAVPAPRP